MTLEEALEASGAEPVNDIFQINQENRTITVPESERIFGVSHDGNTERKHFRCPKIVGDNIDLSTMHLYINYQNANGQKYPYLVEDVQTDGDYITFSWLIGPDVVAYKGQVKFIVCAKKGDRAIPEWNTTFAEGTVLEGLEATDEVVDRNPDIITQLLNRMCEVEKIATKEAMQEYVNTYLTEHPVEIDETLTNPKKAAPADVVGSLKEDLSNKITKFYASNQGEIHLADSDNGKIMDMMLYGKSSQDGTPSPENPVEIKSVVNPTVKVTNEDGLKVQSVTLNNITLNAIPVSSGGNVTIGEQQYISDYLDIEKGKLYRQVKRLNLKDVDVTNIGHGFHSSGNGYLAFDIKNVDQEQIPISNRYKGCTWTAKSGYVYAPDSNNIILVDDRFTDEQTAIKLVQDTYVIYTLSTPTEEDLSLEQIKSLKSLSTNYPVTNISVTSDQLDGYTVFNYPISMENGWNYVKQQLGDTRDYIYDMDAKAQDIDIQSAEAYVNSEYAVALTELEVM